MTAAYFNPPLGSPPSLEFVPVWSIGVDASYQRSVENDQSQKFIRAIARDWDWSLCLPLKLARRDDGSVWAVDGQHRLSAAKLRGDIPHLPCVIGRYPTSADEAAAFVALNRARRPLNGTELFVASLAANDATAIEVMATIKAAGLRIAPHSNFTAWKAGMIFCVPGAVKAFKQRGPKPTLHALTTLATAFEGQVLRYAGTLLDGLYDVYTGRGRAGDFDRNSFAAVLRAVRQDEWVSRALAVQAAEKCSRASAMAIAMLRGYDATVSRPAAPAVAAPPKPAPQPRRSFEETLALVQAGKLTVSERPVMRAPEPDGIFQSGLG